MVRGLRKERIVEALVKLADHQCCPQCYFSYLKPYLDPEGCQALYATTKDCQCELGKSKSVALPSVEYIPLKELK